MRHFEQRGSGLKPMHLSDDDEKRIVCECCESYHHGATEFTRVTRECKQCGQPCRCTCHDETRYAEPGRLPGE
jgi:hypothetical protein